MAVEEGGGRKAYLYIARGVELQLCNLLLSAAASSSSSSFWSFPSRTTWSSDCLVPFLHAIAIAIAIAMASSSSGSF
jgi:hypothetical protein